MKAALALVIGCCTGAFSGTFSISRTIPLPGVKGRIDHLDLDSSGNRLFIAALGNNTLEIVDLRQGKIVRSITGLNEPQGVAFVPKHNRIFVACGGDGTVKIFAGDSLRFLHSVDLGSDADNVRYASGEDRVYVGYGSGGIAALDPDSGTVLARLHLPDHPESFRIEEKGKRIFANVPGENSVEMLDREKGTRLAHWDAGRLRSNFPMALDEIRHRLFIGTRWPARLEVFDTETGKVVAEAPIGGDVDDLFYEPAGHRILASCGAGELDLIEAVDPDRYRLISKVPTEKGARTGLYARGSGEFYLAVPARGARVAEIRVYRISDAR